MQIKSKTFFFFQEIKVLETSAKHLTYDQQNFSPRMTSVKLAEEVRVSYFFA